MATSFVDSVPCSSPTPQAVDDQLAAVLAAATCIRRFGTGDAARAAINRVRNGSRRSATDPPTPLVALSNILSRGRLKSSIDSLLMLLGIVYRSCREPASPAIFPMSEPFVELVGEIEQGLRMLGHANAQVGGNVQGAPVPNGKAREGKWVEGLKFDATYRQKHPKALDQEICNKMFKAHVAGFTEKKPTVRQLREARRYHDDQANDKSPKLPPEVAPE